MKEDALHTGGCSARWHQHSERGASVSGRYSEAVGHRAAGEAEGYCASEKRGETNGLRKSVG